MKKTYIAPLTEVVKINVEQMICESDPASQLSRGSINLNSAESGGGFDLNSKDDFDFSDDLW